jgi:hypothetical protein
MKMMKNADQQIKKYQLSNQEDLARLMQHCHSSTLKQPHNKQDLIFQLLKDFRSSN